MSKGVIIILIILISMPLIVAMNNNVINFNEIYKQEYVNNGLYYTYDSDKGQEVGIKSIYEGLLGILPQYNLETEYFQWTLIENVIGFGKIILVTLINWSIALLKVIGKSLTDGIISIF